MRGCGGAGVGGVRGWGGTAMGSEISQIPL